MKTLYISNNANVLFDAEENTCSSMETQREGIQRIYLAEEPMHVVYSSGEYKREVDVKKDDIVITFYSDDFKERMIVVKSKEWVNNFKAYNKRMQEVREKWAAENNDPTCEACCKAC